MDLRMYCSLLVPRRRGRPRARRARSRACGRGAARAGAARAAGKTARGQHPEQRFHRYTVYPRRHSAASAHYHRDVTMGCAASSSKIEVQQDQQATGDQEDTSREQSVRDQLADHHEAAQDAEAPRPVQEHQPGQRGHHHGKKHRSHSGSKHHVHSKSGRKHSQRDTAASKAQSKHHNTVVPVEESRKCTAPGTRTGNTAGQKAAAPVESAYGIQADYESVRHAETSWTPREQPPGREGHCHTKKQRSLSGSTHHEPIRKHSSHDTVRKFSGFTTPPCDDPESLRLVENSEATVHIESRAVTYAFLRRLTDARVTSDLKQRCNDEGLRYLEKLTVRNAQQDRDLESRREAEKAGCPFITGRDFHRYIIKPDTHDLLCRYVELSGCGDAEDSDGRASVGHADAFVSWNWDSSWESLLAALDKHTTEARQHNAHTPRYWLDLFAVNQHTALPPWKCERNDKDCSACKAVGADMMTLEDMIAGRRDKGFERVIYSSQCAETLVLLEPWFAPRPTTRVWCLYEILLTMTAGKRLTVLSPPAERAELAAALEANLHDVRMKVGAISSERAEATMPEDREQIFAAIRKLLPRSFLELDNKVKERLREWTFSAARDALDEMNDSQRGTYGILACLRCFTNDDGPTGASSTT